MITGIDHIVLICDNLDQGQHTYENLLGRQADWRSQDSTGTDSAFFQLDNMALELLAPQGDGPVAERLRELLLSRGPSLQTLVFGSDELEEDRRIFERRALGPSVIQAGESTDLDTKRHRQWARFRFDDVHTHGVRMFVLRRATGDPVAVQTSDAGALSSLDHLVINTPNPERSVALYGARLGLRMSLDLTMFERDARLLSFKAGRNTIELSHRISKADLQAPDHLWGITWRTLDIASAHQRMTDKGLKVSEIRQGMRKGTKVFTVRDGALNVPTLILSQEEPVVSGVLN